jgi:hypothetical protein
MSEVPTQRMRLRSSLAKEVRWETLQALTGLPQVLLRLHAGSRVLPPVSRKRQLEKKRSGGGEM